ncbi:nickel/cobalt transporter [Halomonas campisalis]|uniref:Nickel/cobalt efflux system n=1 Tax=Billgrantia campisalis TaxID=74661 RepID=A0ABS9PD73_9GAMM|nr:nickel/cobalt transporter [Halomonas campisalis]MCG6659724.1 nickel/cobalt transporter [Halomonas campisalis]MDR5864642.1 nickel/cobalt transporter [Halomonas campisalis]
MRVAVLRLGGKWWLAGAGLLLAALLFHLVFQGGFQSLSFQIVAWQRDLHRALTLAITELSGSPSAGTWAVLLGISFGYGVFHAAGPGHGKAVLTTYLLSQGGAVRRALGLSFAASLLQGVVAIGLVVVLVYGLGWVTRQAMGSVVWVEQASFLMVALLGAWLSLRAIRQLRRPMPGGAVSARQAPHSLAADSSHGHGAHHGHDPQHDHDHCCGGHHHVDPQQAADWRTALATVVAIGMRPCTGAVLLLGAASLLGQFVVGVAAVLVMSLGTALTVSGLALASVVARGWAERRLARQGGVQRAGRLLSWAALGGGLAILILGVSLSVTGVSQPGSAPLLGEPPARSGEAPSRASPFGG